MTNAVSLAQQASTGVSQGFKNRIINGAMVIDQRNAGAAVTVNAADRIYGVDRFFGYGQATDGVFTIDQDTEAPTGFINSTKITTTTADASVGASQYYIFGHSIEGLNTADLGFGTANAKTVTLSFWVRSSLTGQFGGSLTNNGNARSYPYAYTISAANTWEYKTITIAGDTSGTWLTTNGVGINVWWDLGCGSSNIGTAGSWATAGYFGATGDTKLISTINATFYITGVQLEVGSSATSFEVRDYGTELQLCQRYYLLLVRGTDIYFSNGYYYGNNNLYGHITLPVTMRTAPTSAIVSGTNYYVFWRVNAGDYLDSVNVVYSNAQNVSFQNTTEASGTAGDAGGWFTGASASFVALQAEL